MPRGWFSGPGVGVLDARYLMLDCTNDPLTAGLEVNAATTDEPVLTLLTSDDNIANPYLDLNNSGTPMPYIMEKDGTRFLHVYGTDGLFMGTGAGNFTLTGISNTGIGTNAGAALTSGMRNFCLGKDAGLNLTTGSSNCIIGARAGRSLTTGGFNMLFGSTSGWSITTGGNNVGVGEASLETLIAGGGNVGLGSLALQSMVGGDYNIAIGQNAMVDATGGALFGNIALGFNAGGDLEGNANIVIGHDAAANATSAHLNICIGWQVAATLITGDYNILIGRGDMGVEPSGAAVRWELNIGALIYGQIDTNRGGVNVTPPNLAAAWHVDQLTDDAAIPVLLLDQADVDQDMIEFVCTIGVGNAIEAVGAKTLTTTHFIKVTLPGGLTRYIPVGTIA